MARYIALLRGINLGSRNRIAMRWRSKGRAKVKHGDSALAEDLLQECFLRLLDIDPEQVRHDSLRNLRYMILRCLDHVLDPEKPALIRLWGVEYLTRRMLGGDLTQEHRDIIEIIQHVNNPQVRTRTGN